MHEKSVEGGNQGKNNTPGITKSKKCSAFSPWKFALVNEGCR